MDHGPDRVWVLCAPFLVAKLLIDLRPGNPFAIIVKCAIRPIYFCHLCSPNLNHINQVVIHFGNKVAGGNNASGTVSADPVEQLFGAPFHVEAGILLGLVARKPRDPLHEVEDALGRDVCPESVAHHNDVFDLEKTG